MKTKSGISPKSATSLLFSSHCRVSKWRQRQIRSLLVRLAWKKHPGIIWACSRLEQGWSSRVRLRARAVHRRYTTLMAKIHFKYLNRNRLAGCSTYRSYLSILKKKHKKIKALQLFKLNPSSDKESPPVRKYRQNHCHLRARLMTPHLIFPN